MASCFLPSGQGTSREAKGMGHRTGTQDKAWNVVTVATVHMCPLIDGADFTCLTDWQGFDETSRHSLTLTTIRVPIKIKKRC